MKIPSIFFYASYASMALVAISLFLMFLPARFAAKMPKMLRSQRVRLLSMMKRSKELTMEGPLFKLIIWAGRKFGRGYLSSRCRAPDARAKSAGSREVMVTVTPRLGYNPFHEEQYVLSWCREEEAKTIWREKQYNPKEDCEKIAGGKLRLYLEGLPEHAMLRVCACAVSTYGRGEWTREIPVETYAVPTDDGGFQGPLGKACPDGIEYTWAQTKTEVFIKIPLRPEWNAKSIKFKSTPSRLEIRCTGANGGASDEILVGPLHKKVKYDEVFWTIEEQDKKVGRHLGVTLTKFEALDKWSCLIEAPGHTKIDDRLLRFFTDELASLGVPS